MFGCECLYWNKRGFEYYEPDPLPEPFSMISPLPQWPQGKGFGAGRINLGQLEVAMIAKFESVWSCSLLQGKSKGVTFYKPIEIPDGFSCLGYYCQSNDKPLRGYVLVAKDIAASNSESFHGQEGQELPALVKPVGYSLVWNCDSELDGAGYFWLPNPPKGYKAMGFLATATHTEPSLDEVRCVRSDLTASCETCDLILDTDSKTNKYPLQVWKTRPCRRGMRGRGVSVGTFFCSANLSSGGDKLCTGCLKNLDSTLHAMPNVDQIHALIEEYGPTVFFHPDEIYLPSSVSWFFDNGALLYKSDRSNGVYIDVKGSNLPSGGLNDGEFWIDLPDDENKRNYLKYGNLESAELYVHIKPAIGGTFTDIAMWVFCPFNGPATIKFGVANISLNRIGEHVSDWEHFTLRISNFTGELWSIYFSQHSGGEWVDASDLEYIEGNKAIVYSSKSGHASFPHPGTYLQGSSKLGMGVRNDAAKSKFYVDSSVKYKIIAAEYLGDDVKEPCWLQYMREWGPTIVYDGRSELDKIINHLPYFFRFSIENIMDLFPTEIYGEEGPTGPKEKDNWFGDERW